MVTSWFYLVVGVMFFLLLLGKVGRVADRSALKTPILWYLAAMLVEAGFTVFRAGSVGSPRGIILAEFWAAGIQWCVVAVSMILVLNVLLPRPVDSVEVSAGDE